MLVVVVVVVKAGVAFVVKAKAKEQLEAMASFIGLAVPAEYDDDDGGFALTVQLML